jgi:transposase InsO family protein
VRRLTGGQKAGLLALIDDAQAAGWSLERAADLAGVGHRRVQRWRARRTAGTLEDRRPGGNPVHRLLASEEQAVLDLIEEWGKVDRSHRKLAHRGSYLKLVWVSPSTVRRIVAKHGLSLPKDYTPKPAPPRVWPDSITWEPNKIWIWDSRNFTRAKRHVVVIMDVVSRKWIEHIMTPEFTMTQSQLLFMRALDHEGLATLDDIVDDAAGADLADREPVLLAWSDNGAQMTGEDTRQFMALVSIWQHFGRPGTPTDQAHIESFFSHLIFDYPHLDHINDPVVLSTELARIRIEYNEIRLHAGVGYVTPNDEHEGRGPAIRRARARGLKQARQNRINHNRNPNKPPEQPS